MHTEQFCLTADRRARDYYVSNLETESTEVGCCNCWLLEETFEFIEGFKSCELWHRVDL